MTKGKQVLWVVASMICGWIVVWAPTHLANHYYGDMPLLLLTLLLPLTTFTGHAMLRLIRGKHASGPSIAAFMFLGMWTLEPTYLWFTSSDITWRLYLLFTIFPGYTFILSCYAGAIGGLFLCSCLLVIEHCVLELHNWILPFRFGRPSIA